MMSDYNYINYNSRLLTDKSDKYWQLGHIWLLIFGLAFFVSGALHENMWFDEAYTVAMLRHGFFRICEITARDVHPPLYYMIVKLASLIWGQNILVYRLVSVAGMGLFSLLGYTHIRKILGAPAGFYYTFLAIFLPVMLEYSAEARMYSWAMFFTTAAGIYAYLSCNQNQPKFWALFAIFSLCGAYTHYYALLGLIFVNLLLLAIAFQSRSLLKPCLSAIAIQVAFYLPWTYILIKQIISVTTEYWIVINYPYLFRDFSVFYFAEHLPQYVSQALSLILLIVGLVGIYKALNQGTRHSEIAPASLFIYLGVIVLALVLSFLVKPIFITRYLMPNSGFLFIALAIGLASFRRRLTPFLLCLAVLTASFTNFYFNYVKVYSPLNYSLRNNIADSLKPDDVFLYTDIHPAGIYTVSFPANKHYVYFPSDDSQSEPEPDPKPNPFQPELEIIHNLDVLKEYQGRIWLIEGAYSQYLYGQFGKNEDLFTVLDYARTYDMPYLSHKGFNFVGSLFEKKAGPIPNLK